MDKILAIFLKLFLKILNFKRHKKIKLLFILVVCGPVSLGKIIYIYYVHDVLVIKSFFFAPLVIFIHQN